MKGCRDHCFRGQIICGGLPIVVGEGEQVVVAAAMGLVVGDGDGGEPPK